MYARNQDKKKVSLYQSATYFSGSRRQGDRIVSFGGVVDRVSRRWGIRERRKAGTKNIYMDNV